MTGKTTEFDEIRPYHDEELPSVYESLIKDDNFKEAIGYAIPNVPFELIANKMRTCKTKLEFQKTFCYTFLEGIIKQHTNGLSLDSKEELSPNKGYTFISNHRDIVLDSGFLSVSLVNKGLDTVEIAIGDNLLIYPWIKQFVRINKSFIVQRALSMRQMLESSARMSRYMHYTIQDKKQSIWIAQREGRAKDSNDRTQDSLLKMFAMGGEGDIIERLLELNITPLTLSYEYDPCDYLKAQEFQLKRDNEEYKKSQADDLLNMQTGIIGFKGKVHQQVGTCINEELKALDKNLSKGELFKTISQLIDRQIHSNYKIYPVNWIALDLLRKNNENSNHYTEEEVVSFKEYINKQIDKINIENKDVAYLEERILEMYANPLINYLAVNK